MLAPTLYFLEITQRRNGGYEIWETHCGQEQGCVSTQPEFVDFVNTKKEAKAIVDDWRANPPFGGILKDVNWDELPELPELDRTDFNDIRYHGEYYDLVDLVLAISELSGIKPYRVVDDNDGRFLKYTFEVVE